MVDIDERVVSMKFDSSDFEKKSKSTLSLLDKLKDKLSFKDAVSSSADNLNAITDNVEKMASKSYTILDRMKDKIIDNIAGKLVNYVQENTVGQLQKGWTKYADMTTSVATLKSQGYAMDKITDQLERLNYFTDETSYNFTDMVREIGKFTASGQSLEDATTAMMGIANWAALSGKNANDASRAMYQLSQALGAGQMRLQDYKSVQNLNMDTMEFRKNAIEAAIAAGTLKDNLNGTFTSLKNSKITFTLQSFTESLTQGKWFDTKVMMDTYKKYSEAVDEIRQIAEEEQFTNVEGVTSYFETSADAIRAVKENNELLVEKFQKKNAKLTTDEINNYLKRWKKVEKVTDETIKNYAEINKLTEEEAKKEMEGNYAQYLKEYADVFKDAEKSAEEAMDDWHTYVSDYGLKAFSASQEAKTFGEAIESAKDAASTVWMGIYQDIFGDYNEAKEIWTDLANALYEIFVTRISKIKEIFDFWKTGYEKEAESEIKNLKEEYDNITKNGAPTDDYTRQRANQIKSEMEALQKQLDSGLLNGRRVLFQGLYAFGGGLKEALKAFRSAWDELFTENETGKKLFSISEKIRVSGFQFYNMIKQLKTTEFFKNIAQGIKNIITLLKTPITILKAVIGQFVPAGDTAQSILVKISEAFKNLTAKLVPSQETIVKIAKILRGVGSVIRFIGKVLYALWITIGKPIVETAWELLSNLFSIITDVGAAIADAFFETEKGMDPMESLAAVGETLKNVLLSIIKVLGEIVKEIVKFVSPAINFLKNTIGELINKIKGLFKGGNGNALENIADGFKDIGKRAKEAWTQGETLADVFNKFKGGTGLPNFLQMIGAMLDNLVSRIGHTIAAILGLDEEVAKSKIGEGIKTAKDIIVQAFAIIKWLYTNVIKPTFQLLFDGIANALHNVGEAFRSGDFNYFLTSIKNLAKTIGALEIVKLIRMITKILSSGGLLKVLKNGAKALKGVYKYFSAKATNELASALIKMAAALGIVVGIMTALTFLPDDKLAKLGPLLLQAGIAMAVMLGGVALLGATMKLLNNPLDTVTGMFWSMTIAMITTISVVYLLKKAFGDLWQEVKVGENADGTAIMEEKFNFERLFTTVGGALAPILMVFGTLLAITAIAKKIGAGSALKDFSIAIAALGVSMLALSYGLTLMVDFVNNVSFEEGAAAILAMSALLLVMTLAGVAMSKFSSTIGSWKSGLATAIAMAGMVLAVSLVVIPCLDDMVQHKDKFPQYVEALGIFAMTMLSISASMWLMSVGTKGGFHMLAAGLVFNNVTKVVKNFLLPMLIEIQQIDFSNSLSGIAALGALVLAIAGGIRLIIDGVANVITALSKINWKNWVAIIGSTGLMIALIIAMVNIFEMAGFEISIASILAPLGVVITICLAFGLFAKSLSKSLGSGDKTRVNIIKVFNSIMAILAIIGGSMIAMITIVGVFYKNDNLNAVALIGTFALSVMLILVSLTNSFSTLVSRLIYMLGGVDREKFKKVKELLNFMLTFMGTIMGGFLLTVVGTGITYTNPVASLAPVLGMLVATTIGMALIKQSMVDLFTEVISLTRDLKPAQFKNAMEVTRTLLIATAAILGIISAAIVNVGWSYGNGNAWQSIVSAIAIVVAVVGSLYSVVMAFKEISKLVQSKEFTDAVYKKFKTMIIIMGAYITLIIAVLISGLNAMSDRIGINFANAIVMVGMVVATTAALTFLFAKLINSIHKDIYSKDKLIALAMTFLAMTTITAQISGFFSRMSEYELADWTTGLAFAISVSAFLISLGFAMEKIISAVQWIPNDPEKLAGLAISMMGVIGVVIATSLLLKQMDRLTGVDWSTALAALAGLSLLVWSISSMMKIIMTMSSGTSRDYNVMFGSVLALFLTLASIAGLSPFIFSAFKELEGVGWDSIAKGLVAILVPFGVMFMLITSIAATPIGDAFLMTSLKIAAGIAAIAAAALAVAGVIYLIKEMFNLGQDSAEAYMDGFNSDKGMGIHSNSKTMKKDAKWIVGGLAAGIKQNRRTAINAATGLATYTNDGFCDELGIASPSKVFYENGRFVVRGFINGMNDEANKNKQAGADMAEGFSDGMDEAMDGMKDKWKGLWMDSDMENTIKDAMENGTAGLPGIFENAIFGETNEKLTEAEEKELDELLKRRDEIIKNHGQGTKEFQDTITRITELQEKQKKAGSNSLTSNLGDSISNALSNALGGSDVSNTLSEKLGGLKDTVLGFISGEGTESLTNAITGNGGVLDTVGAKLGLNGKLSDKIEELTKDEKVQTALGDLGKKVGESIYDGMTSWTHDILDWFDNLLHATKNKEQNLKTAQNILDTKGDIYGWNDEDKTLILSWFNTLMAKSNTENAPLTVANVEDILKTIYDNGDFNRVTSDTYIEWTGFWEDVYGGLYGLNETDKEEDLIKSYITEIKKYQGMDYNALKNWDQYDLLNGLRDVMPLLSKDDKVNGLRDLYEGKTGINQFFQFSNDEENKLAEYIVDNLGLSGRDVSEFLFWGFNEHYLSYDPTTRELEIINGTADSIFTRFNKRLNKINKYNGTPGGSYNGQSSDITEETKENGKTLEEIKSSISDDTVEAINNMLTENGYAKLDKLTKNQIEQIIEEAAVWSVLDENGEFMQRDEDNADRFEELLNFIRDITNNGLKVYDSSKPYNDPTYTAAKSAKSLSYLQSLSDKARTDSSAAKELNRLTNGKGISGFVSTLKSDYTSLVKYMSSDAYGKLDSSQKEYYQTKRDFYEKYYELGVAKSDGMADGTVEEHDKRANKVAKDTVIKDQETVYKLDQDGSPSEVYYRFGKWRALGMQNGFEDAFNVFSKLALKNLQGLNKDSEIALMAMADSLDDETIQPTITPIYDDSNLYTAGNISSIGASMKDVVKATDAAVNSFADDTPNYNGPLTALSNQVAALTNVVNGFMQMVADGDIVTVNVNAEADPNNIYNLVVNSNRQKFRQTGKNPLAY